MQWRDGVGWSEERGRGHKRIVIIPTLTSVKNDAAKHYLVLSPRKEAHI